MKAHTPGPALESFAALPISPTLKTGLEKMKIHIPTAVQSESIPEGLKGSDLIAIAETGSGKTLAYALSLLTRLEEMPAARALVLTSSRETADQVHHVFDALAKDHPISLCLVTSGIPNATQVSQLKKNPRLIIATPGRLNDHLRNNKLLLQGLQILVLDEADRMLELGFEPQLQFMQSTLRGERQTMMFAASFGPKSEIVAKMFLKPGAIKIRTASAGGPVETLEQRVLFLSPSQKQNRLLDELRKMRGPVLIFTGSQESCASLGRLLAHHELPSDFAHGDMNPGHRNRVLREMREGKIQIMVTTDLLARGLDIPDLEHVVNFDLPYKAEDFLHRIGRTARAGRSGRALTFITPADGRSFRKIKPYLTNALEETIARNFQFEDRG